MEQPNDNPPPTTDPTPTTILPQPTKQPEQQSPSSPKSKSSQDYSSSSQHSDKIEPQIQASGEKPIDKVRSDNKRYKYCCKKCKHTQRNKKACVCVVPLSQRITQLGNNGCQSCGCIGCSFEDYISRGEDPEYKPTEKKPNEQKDNNKQQQEIKTCCQKCKSCICAQSVSYRKGKIPSNGCKMCGCQGCTYEDKKEQQQQQQNRNKGRRNSQHYQGSRSRSRDKRRRQRSQSQQSYEKIDPVAYNFNNFDRSIIGAMISDFRVYPSLLGFGIPQRSQSYIIGKPK